MSQSQSQTIQYPLPKSEVGKHIWIANHQIASLYPDEPTQKEKERTKLTILTNMSAIAKLCKNCKIDIKQYLRSNPLTPALKGRKELSNYLCNFHNYVNKKLDKETVNCENILRDTPTCDDCVVKVENDDSTKEKEEKADLNLKQSFEAFKKATVSIFETLCKKYNLPVPHFKFHECPSNPTVSCTEMLIDKETKQVVERPTIYFHPNVYGLRTIPHEFLHYAKQMKGDNVASMDEKEIESLTQDLIFKEFPYDEKVVKKPLTMPVIRADIYSTMENDGVPSHLSKFPMASSIYRKYVLNARRYDHKSRKQEGEGDWLFDMFKKPHEVENSNEAPLHNIEEDFHSVFSFLDDLYRPFGNILGIKASDLNLGQTPPLLTNAILTIVQSNLTPLGSLIFSTLTAVGIFSALAIGKNGMTYGDRRFMNSIGSVFFWDSINYLNPKQRGDVIESAMALGEVISTNNFSAVPDILVDSPYLGMLDGGVPADAGSFQTESTTAASPQSGVRSAQRSAGRGGSSSSGRVGSLGGSSRAQTKRQLEAQKNQRNLQRQTGIHSTGKQFVPTRDVPTGAASGNPSRTVLPDVKRNTINLFDEDSTVILPNSEYADMTGEDGEYFEIDTGSSFGTKVADGRPRSRFDFEDGGYGYDDDRNTFNVEYEGGDNYDEYEFENGNGNEYGIAGL